MDFRFVRERELVKRDRILVFDQGLSAPVDCGASFDRAVWRTPFVAASPEQAAQRRSLTIFTLILVYYHL